MQPGGYPAEVYITEFCLYSKLRFPLQHQAPGGINKAVPGIVPQVGKERSIGCPGAVKVGQGVEQAAVLLEIRIQYCLIPDTRLRYKTGGKSAAENQVDFEWCPGIVFPIHLS